MTHDLVQIQIRKQYSNTVLLLQKLNILNMFFWGSTSVLQEAKNKSIVTEMSFKKLLVYKKSSRKSKSTSKTVFFS